MKWRPFPERFPGHLLRVLRSLPTAAAATWEEVRGAGRPSLHQLLSEAEQAPNPASRITLSTRVRDPFGRPAVRLEWRTTELDRRSIVENQRRIDRALCAANVGRILHGIDADPRSQSFAGHWHHIGTTRMHDSRRRGVVDRHCRVHGMRNLYVAGSSVFPTSGYANPTLTIVALAVRLADRITGEIGRLD